jgi:putative NIF3 family GTP cyclohydrolase 1 type 2
MKVFCLILCFLPFGVYSQHNSISAEDIVNRIKKQVTCQWSGKTVDTFKSGNPNDKVTGIVTCMFADMDVLRRAVELNCNFIITHEPAFYNHLDETEAFKNDPVYREKRKFLTDNKLIIFRFHDHIHRTQPDGIYAGMINKLGWEKHLLGDSQLQFQFEESSLQTFSEKLKDKLGLESIRIIGNPEMKFTRVALAVGAPGGSRHIQLLQNPEIEVLVAGEAPEWETYLYANDAVQQKKNKAVIFLGHIKSEEAGMEYCVEWLKGFVQETPIYFVENQANFTEL